MLRYLLSYYLLRCFQFQLLRCFQLQLLRCVQFLLYHYRVNYSNRKVKYGTKQWCCWLYSYIRIYLLGHLIWKKWLSATKRWRRLHVLAHIFQFCFQTRLCRTSKQTCTLSYEYFIYRRGLNVSWYRLHSSNVT